MSSIQNNIDLEEKKNHGTKQFPFAYYYANTYDAPCVVSYHWHKETEIIYVEAGEVIITIDGSASVGTEGEIFFVNPSQLHQVMIEEEGSRYFSLVFDMDWLDFKISDYVQTTILDPLKKDLGFPLNVTSAFSCHEALVRELRSLRQIYEMHPDNYQLMIKLNLYRIILLMDANKLLVPGTSHVAMGHSTSAIRIQEMMDYITHHYQEHITLEQAAEIMHMSPKYFSSFFSKTFLISFAQFLNNYRIDQACILLKTTDMPVLEISFEVGFENISYFTKKFKELKGLTPKEYRKRTNPVK
ncbi:MAG: helix-turn-helix transcriptional regulator [Clostridiales bacterium]|nr:helix-turn-helix transcriptional regulator [Candidatus Blautia equi]